MIDPGAGSMQAKEHLYSVASITRISGQNEKASAAIAARAFE